MSQSQTLKHPSCLTMTKKEIFSSTVRTRTLSNKLSPFNNKLILPTPCQNLWFSGPLSIANTVGEAGRNGLSSTLTVKCTHCWNLNNVNTSGQHRAESRGPLARGVNTRAVLGSLHIGIGQTQLNNLLTTLNVPPVSNVLFKRWEREMQWKSLSENFVTRFWKRKRQKQKQNLKIREKRMV